MKKIRSIFIAANKIKHLNGKPFTPLKLQIRQFIDNKQLLFFSLWVRLGPVRNLIANT